MGGEETYVYVISCRRLERLKIGVADDPGKRLRELQVGSPAELTLAHTQAYAERRDAVAVCEELYRCFAEKRDRGRWYRLTLEQVRHGLARRATVEAPQRARAAEAARASRLAAGRRKRSGGRTEKQLAYGRRRRQQRRQKQRRAGRLLGQGMTQEQAAAAVGVSSRTLRNWKTAPAFRRELERSQQRRLHEAARERSRRATSPARRQPAQERVVLAFELLVGLSRGLEHDDHGDDEQIHLVDEVVLEQPPGQDAAAVHLQLTRRPGLQVADGGREIAPSVCL